jgi:homocysteine S-methyltransferase
MASAFAAAVAAGGPILTDGGIETRLIYEDGVELPAHVEAAGLVGHPALRAIYASYLEAAAEHGLPIVIGTPTFRADASRAAAAGLDVRTLNARAVAHHRALRDEHPGGPPVFVAGVLGPRGDAYTPAEAPDPDEAERHHRPQAEALAQAGADFLFAATFPAVGEAIGVCRAMGATGLPSVVSWVLDGDGRVLDGTPLAEAVAQVDAVTDPAPLMHSLSCIHPTVAAHALAGAGPAARGRILECKANASTLPTAELVHLDHLEGDDAATFAAAMAGLRTDHGLRVLGGCCGTDAAHIRALAALLAGG